MEGIQRSHAVQDREVGEFALDGYEAVKNSTPMGEIYKT